MKKIKGKVLSIAGSDSAGGAGIQADIKTITAMGAYASTAITAITAQNTLGVQEILELPINIIKNQIRAVLSDIGTDAIKIGMLSNKETISCVTNELKTISANTPIVLDPVMVAKGGKKLLQEDAEKRLISDLFPISKLLTPNIPEAEKISKIKINSTSDLLTAGKIIINMGIKNVLMKGGHLDGNKLVDILVTKDKIQYFENTRIHTNHTHGTGCTLSSSIASGLAQKLSLSDSIERAHTYVYQAIKYAPEIGRGKGPLNHLVGLDINKIYD